MDDNEKLRLAKEALDSGSYDKETIYHIFPELRESEDDRIRDEICTYIGSKQDISLDVHNRWISWLEKQSIIKSEWTDVDEYMLNETVKHLEMLIRIEKNGIDCDSQHYQRDIDWLKLIKQRIGG